MIDPFYLLDNDFSDEELTRMGISVEEVSKTTALQHRLTVKTLQDVATGIQTQLWKSWLFTSGTTGLPKKVCHSYQSLGRNVRISKWHQKDVWAFAYRMSHMAGVQVLLQALANRNPLIYVFESTPLDVVNTIRQYGCTHISATPTFYRNILPYITEPLPALRHLTLGGERFDGGLCDKIKELLPAVKIHNIYASTEAGSLLQAKGDKFIIPPICEGKICISQGNELLVHRSLLGNFPVDGEWYNTHDLVKEENGTLQFLSRQSDLVNVGGYKVNPLEVEDMLKQVPEIVDCIVRGEKNSVVGNLLVADLQIREEADFKKVKQDAIRLLRAHLQPFKVPRIFHFVESVTRTRTGKKVRK